MRALLLVTLLPLGALAGEASPAATTPAEPAAPQAAESGPAADASAAAPAGPGAPALRYRLAVGVNVGMVHVVGLQSTATLFANGRPRFDVDLLWEPSGFLQSYSVGAAWHPFDRVFYLGVRARLLQWHFPGTRGYVPERDNHLGIGLEGGMRAPIAVGGRLLLNINLGGTIVATAGSPLQGLLNITVGVAFAALQR